MHLEEIFDFTLTQGHWIIALYIMWPMFLQSLNLIQPMVKEIHYQENTLFDLDPMHGQEGQGHTKCCPVTSTSCDICTSKVWCCYISWLRRCIYKKYIIWVCITKCTQYPWHHVSDLCTSKVWYCYIPRLRRRIYKKIHYRWVKVTRNAAQCPLHHVTYATTEFAVTTSKGLGGDAFTRKINIWPLPWHWGQGHMRCCPVPSTSCDLFSYKVWSC